MYENKFDEIAAMAQAMMDPEDFAKWSHPSPVLGECPKCGAFYQDYGNVECTTSDVRFLTTLVVDDVPWNERVVSAMRADSSAALQLSLDATATMANI
jgi:hypothetical protein